MKEVGIIVDNDFNNDIRVRNQAEIYLKNGFKVHVLCFWFQGAEKQEIKGIKYHYISIKRGVKNALFLLNLRFPFYQNIWVKAVRNLIQKEKLDFLHVHDLYMSKPVRKGIKAIGKNIPLVLDLHENYPVAVNSYNWTKGWKGKVANTRKWVQLEKEYLSYADYLITLSDIFRKKLIKRYSFLTAENCLTFPNILNLGQFDHYELDTSIKRIKPNTLFYFGGVAERRGIFQTLDVIEELIQENRTVFLLIIGPVDKSDKSAFFSRIESEHLKDHVHFIDWIHVSKLKSYLQVVDVCLAPFVKNEQHESGVANKIFQYMYGAKPIIASNCKPQMELIEKYDCGLVFDSNETFKSAITTLLDDKEAAKAKGEKGKAALKDYSFEVVSEKLIGFIREAVSPE